MSPLEFRDTIRLNRAILLMAPVFWASFSVCVSPCFGIAGFAIHFLICFPRKTSTRIITLLAYPALCFVFAILNPSLTLNSIPFHHRISGGNDFRFRTGEVTSFPSSNTKGEYGSTWKTSEGESRIILSNHALTPPPLGATILLLAREESPEPAANPGQRDPVSILRGQGIATSLQGINWSELKPPSRWNLWVSRIRTCLGHELEKHIPSPALPLMQAALLNDTRNVSFSTQQDFTRSGMQHILAISGQHIALLIAFLLFPALCLRLPRKFAFVLAGILAAVYIPVTGSSVSMVRAGLMLGCFLPSVFLERPPSGVSALCLAASVDLLINPFHILNLGFQLSYAATLALILCSPSSRLLANRFKHRWLGCIVQMVFLSGMVSLFTYPLLAASTHAISPWSILGNLVAIPISGAMLIGGLCTWAFSPVPVLAHWCGACTGMCALTLESFVHFLAKLPNALWPIAEISPAGLTLLIMFVILITILFQMERWRLGFLATGIFIAVEFFRPCFSASFPDEARVTVLSVGHGDASVLELPGKTILIDAGPSPGTALRVILPFLQSRGIRRLDAVLLTHPDMDHYGGMFALVDAIPIGFILSPRLRSADAPWVCLKDRVHSLGIPWKEGRMGDLLYQKGGVDLRILGPDSTLDSASDNNHSLVCLLRTSHGNAFFTGDIEAPAQQALASTWPLWRGAWLKAPHHGSDRTTLPCFLSAAAPPQVAVSSGHRPGFPGRHTLDVLKNLHSHVITTAQDGAALWNFDSDHSSSRNFRVGF